MNVFNFMQISVIGFVVERLRMDIIIFNIVNVSIIRSVDGSGFYVRRVVVF